MNVEALFLFLILLLGIVLCSFLGEAYSREGLTGKINGTFEIKDISSGASTGSSTTYDNYNHYYRDSTQLLTGSTYYGPNGSTAKVETDSSGKQRIVLYFPQTNDKIIMMQLDQNQNRTRENFQNTNIDVDFENKGENATARIVSREGAQGIEVNTPTGLHFFSSQPSQSSSTTSTQYFGATGSHTQTVPNTTAYQRYHSYDTVQSSALPTGIPRSQIPPGQEDLYILKTEVVPPVCPVCPTAAAVPRQEQCPPCPACARCPEPAFECKKVPNYNAMNGGTNTLPIPVLSDFSQFGM